MIDKEWIPLAGALLAVVGTIGGIILGGTITSIGKWLELRHARKAAEETMFRLKLERCHQLIGEHLSIVTDIQSSIIAKLALHSDLPSRVPIYQEMHSRLQTSLIPLTAELRIYQPHLETIWQRAFSASHSFSAVIADVVWEKKSLEDSFEIFTKTKTNWSTVQNEVEKSIRRTFRFVDFQDPTMGITKVSPSGESEHLETLETK
jgi:hypothetical protein